MRLEQLDGHDVTYVYTPLNDESGFAVRLKMPREDADEIAGYQVRVRVEAA